MKDDWFIVPSLIPPTPPPSRDCDGINCRVDAKQPHNATKINPGENSSINSRDVIKASALPGSIKVKPGTYEFTLKFNRVEIRTFLKEDGIEHVSASEAKKIIDPFIKMSEDVKNDPTCPGYVQMNLRFAISLWKKRLSEYESTEKTFPLEDFLNETIEEFFKSLIFRVSAETSTSSAGENKLSDNEKKIKDEFTKFIKSSISTILGSKNASSEKTLELCSGRNKIEIKLDEIRINTFLDKKNWECMDFDAYGKSMNALIEMLEKLENDPKCPDSLKTKLKEKIIELKEKTANKEKNSKEIFPLKMFIEHRSKELSEIFKDYYVSGKIGKNISIESYLFLFISSAIEKSAVLGKVPPVPSIPNNTHPEETGTTASHMPQPKLFFQPGNANANKSLLKNPFSKK
jgi:hypothetical protein